MRAAVFQAPGQMLCVEERPDPQPGDGEVVVKVCRCGICGTDLHMTEPGTGTPAEAGSVLGHEYAGEVVAVGPGVERLRVGDRIAAIPIRSCGRCLECALGRPARCAGQAMQFGGYGQFARVQEFTSIRLPADLSLEDGALVEPLAVALHGTAPAGIEAGSSVTIIGAGPIGLGALFWARRLGAGRITVIEKTASRQALAMTMGATMAVTPEAHDPAANLSDIVVEAVGRPGMLAAAMAHVRAGGTVVSLGCCMEPDSVLPTAAAIKELTFKFPMAWTKRDFEVAADVLASGAVEPRAMLTDVVALDALPQAFEALRKPSGQCKVVVAPWG